MILIFAPNPALERVALTDAFQPGEPQKPMRVSTWAGGAGLRAASVARLLGGDVLALGFVGGHLGALLRDCLERQDVPHVLTPTQADTRGDFLLLDRNQGVVTRVPEDPPAYTEREADKLLATLGRHLGSAQLLIVADARESGDTTLLLRALAQAKAASVPTIVDVRGDNLETVVGAGVWLVRVNLQTLQKRTEQSLQHDSAILSKARAMLDAGVENVCVTLAEDGALLVNAQGAWRVQPPVVSHFNPTGSGETLVGALAVWWEKTGDIVQAVRYGCAAASVNVTHDEPGFATPGEVNILFPRTSATRVAPR